MNRFEAYELSVRQAVGERGYSRRKFVVDTARTLRKARASMAGVGLGGAVTLFDEVAGSYLRIRYAHEHEYKSVEQSIAVYDHENLKGNMMILVGDSNMWGDVEQDSIPHPYPSALYIQEQMKGLEWVAINKAKPGMVAAELLERLQKRSFWEEISKLAANGTIDFKVGIGGNNASKDMLLDPIIRRAAEELRDHPRRLWNSRDNIEHNLQWTWKASRLAKKGEEKLTLFEQQFRQILGTLFSLQRHVPAIKHISIFGVPYVTLQDKVVVPVNGEPIPIDFTTNPDARNFIHGAIASLNTILKRNVAALEVHAPGVFHFVPVENIIGKDDLRYQDVHLTKAGQQKVAKHEIVRLVDQNKKPLIVAA